MVPTRLKSRRERLLLLYLTLVAFLSSMAVPAIQFISGGISFRSKLKDKLLLTNTTAAVAQALDAVAVIDLGPSKGPIAFGGVLARPFDPWPRNLSLPCFPPEADWKSVAVQESPSEVGLLYMKPYKTGSSTCAGINLRIARNVAQRQDLGHETCRARFAHGPWKYPALKLYGTRSSDRSYLWTVIRDPTKRAISMFFHMEVSRKKQEPTDENFQQYLLDEKASKWDYYVENLSTDRYQRGQDDPVEYSNGILDEYNFIGITERMDESAVALMMLLDLRMADILFLSAKGKGSYDDAGGQNGQCTYIWKSFVTPGMEEFFLSDEWQTRIKSDLALYNAAERSLDLTIDRLGRAVFQENLAKYQHAKDIVAQRCLPTVILPCDEAGARNPRKMTDCLWKDSGCGTACLDEVSTALGLWS